MTALLTVVAAAVLTALAFPRIGWFWLAWIGLAPLFSLLLKGKRSIFLAYFFGLIYFGWSYFWLFSLWRFAGWWVLLGWVLLIVFQALFLLVFILVYQLLKRPFPLLSIPIAWTTAEWLRALGPFGSPVGDLGYSQAAFLPLIQIASLTTVYGVSFLLVLLNASIARWLNDEKRWPELLLAGALFAMAIVYGQAAINLAPPAKAPLKAILIQPNIDQWQKIDPNKVNLVFEKHLQLTRLASRSSAEVIIWPETAVFAYLFQNNNYRQKVLDVAREKHVWLVVGTPYYEAIRQRSFNAIVAVSPSGEIISVYGKRRLVPFGEYLPWRRYLYPLMKKIGYFDDDFHPETKKGNYLIQAGRLKVAAAVCFESTFPETFQNRWADGADLLLTLTNDGWFGDSAAPYQHLQMDVFRAVENRKYFIQVGNTGFTVMIDPFGRIVKKAEFGKEELLDL